MATVPVKYWKIKHNLNFHICKPLQILLDKFICFSERTRSINVRSYVILKTLESTIKNAKSRNFFKKEVNFNSSNMKLLNFFTAFVVDLWPDENIDVVAFLKLDSLENARALKTDHQKQCLTIS